jgi:hypothetical protein
MTWIQFFMWSVIVYASYFGFNILLDTRKRVRVNSDNGADDVLHFTETQAPTKVKVVEVPIKQKMQEPATSAEQKEKIVNTPPKQDAATTKATDKAIEANGGVSLGGMFTLARQEAIHITKKIDFTTPGI